jgi:hypothetical protein
MVRNLIVKISGMRMASYTLSPHQKARSTSVESTSGLSEKLRVRSVVNDPNPTGKHTTDLVTYSKPKSKTPTKISSDEKLSLYIRPKVV